MAVSDPRQQAPLPAPTDPVQQDDLLPREVVRIVNEYVREAEEARTERMALNRRNREMYLGIQDFSHKIEGQSTESIPKLAEAAEQFAAFVKRGLTSLGDWFTVELPDGLPLNGEQAARLIKTQLDKIGETFVSQPVTFPAWVGDAIKQGLLESLIVAKVHSGPSEVARRVMNPDGSFREYRPWRVKLDLVRTEDYYPDPTGKRLYEVQTTWMDLHEVEELAEQGIFDPTVVKDLRGEYDKPRGGRSRAQQRSERERGQNETTGRRKMVRIDECWGTLVNAKGKVVAHRQLCAVANEKYLVRPPEPNPYWHGESCFVTAPIVRVPHSVWHRALYDDGAAINAALNELFNLMLDGGLAAVWGIKELRLSMLEDPSQVSGGIRQGMTLVLADDAPAQQHALEAVDTGSIPKEALDLYQILDREFQAAVLTNDLKLGMLPPKQVKATEIVEASQSAAITTDQIIQDIETTFIAPLLRKVWFVILQDLERFDAREVIDAIGMEAAARLMSLPPAERFNQLALANIKVHGISGLFARARDFQKLLGVSQIVFSNPFLLQSFMRRFSVDKLLDQILRLANVQTAPLQLTPQERMQQMLQQMMIGGPLGAGGTPPGGGDANPMQAAGGPSLPNPENGPGPRPPAEAFNE